MGTCSRAVEAQITPTKPSPTQASHDGMKDSDRQRSATADIASTIINGATMSEIRVE